jgi:hypothetical protein
VSRLSYSFLLLLGELAKPSATPGLKEISKKHYESDSFAIRITPQQ